MNEGQHIKILLVEDNPGDVRLTKEALRDAKVGNDLYVAQDGVRAMDFLYQRGDFADAPRPDLVLLDLDLPEKDGRQVLRDIKSDEALKDIPVIVFTSSHSEEDILGAYASNVNCYITKPVEFDEFMDVVRAIEDFWLTVVQLPRHWSG